MNSSELRQKFLDFFEKRDHKVVDSSSLIPADPTSLFTSAGMQQFVLYFSGEVEPPYRRACSVQKCFRADDIDEVGDAFHHTFFEMLGNWSFGDYFKEGAIDFALEFLVDELKIERDKLWITIFKGEKGISRDEEAFKIWQSRGIKKEKIFEFGMKDNFWGPIAKTGPCGPCSEIFYELYKNPCKEKCGPNCDCGRFVEIWNLVFMEYNKDEKGNFEKLSQQNIDTGIGFERLVSILQKKESSYETDLFGLVIKEIENLSNKKYERAKRSFRILADHLRAACFLISEGVLPSNVDRGYVLRKILRRSIRYAKILDLPENWYVKPIKEFSIIYGQKYPQVRIKEETIITVIQSEEEKFGKALERGLKEFEKFLEAKESKFISGKEAFDLYQSYGFPLELIKEMAQEKGLTVDEVGFKSAFEKHRQVSKKGAEKKFGGIGKQATYDAIKLHTATHLLHQALREVLGEHVRQMGSDIISQRLRFDFSHPQKMTVEEIKSVEEMVNQKIKEDLEVKREEMSLKEALNSGALAFFKMKYPQKVTVYSINNTLGKVFSKEICAGPHVQRTSELGRFKIKKEESLASGVRRIRAILEKKD